MTKSAVINALMVALFATSGATAWWLLLQPALEPDVRPLSRLPLEIAGWQSLGELGMETAVEAELEADLNVQRTYEGHGLPPVWLYIGYYGTERGGRPRHVPRGCYTGAGWTILGTRVLDVSAQDPLRTNEYVIERNGERRLVHYWYRSYRRTGMLGGFDQNLDRAVGRITDRRADGALVRLSTPILATDEVTARGRLTAFAAALDPILGAHWPTEAPGR